jgi:hypothetical protein
VFGVVAGLPLAHARYVLAQLADVAAQLVFHAVDAGAQDVAQGGQLVSSGRAVRLNRASMAAQECQDSGNGPDQGGA